MMLYPILVFIHIVAATIWVGRHLILSIRFLPKALNKKDFSIIQNFEKAFEPIGLPSLLVSIITGVWLFIIRMPALANWFDFNEHLSRHFILKALLLLITIVLAIHARFFLIPKQKLKPLAIHIVIVTLIAVLFVMVGVSLRTALLF